MMRQLSILLLLIGRASCHGADYQRCKTKVLDQAVVDEQNRMIKNRSQKRSAVRTCTQCITIQTYFHVFQPDATYIPGELPIYSVDEAKAREQFDVMVDRYKDSPFTFNLVSVNIITNNQYYAAFDGLEETIGSTYRQGDYSTLNVYFGAAGQGSFAFFPPLRSQETNNNINPIDGAWNDISTMPGVDPDESACCRLGITAVHEVGHWLGLHHTFEQQPGFIDDGCNAANPNDYVDDTPQQFTNTPFTCPGDDTNTCPNLPGNDPIHNYMDYSSDPCYTEFTRGQMDRMYFVWSMFRQSTETCGTGAVKFELNYRADSAACEFNWQLQATDGSFQTFNQQDGGFEVFPNGLSEQNIVLDICIDTDKEYTFTIFDSGSDGLDPEFGYTVTVDGTVVKTGQAFGASESVTFSTGTVTTPAPTNQPTPDPTPMPTPQPTPLPTPQPTDQPTPNPTTAPPSPNPTPFPTTPPVVAPTPPPTPMPTPDPTPVPTMPPTPDPTPQPTNQPTPNPTTSPPSPNPTPFPTTPPVVAPTPPPTSMPTPAPTPMPTFAPTPNPTPAPTPNPTPLPTPFPTTPPQETPTPPPTVIPTSPPTPDPTPLPTFAPTPIPTTPPQTAPSPPPTPQPTPTPGASCDDDPVARFFVQSTGRSEPCIWLASRPAEQTALCAMGQPARNICRETCRVCSDNCEDTNGRFNLNNVRRSCLWLSLRNNVISQVCVAGNEAYTMCPETCNNPDCEGGNPPTPTLTITTPPPTSKPTRQPSPRPTAINSPPTPPPTPVPTLTVTGREDPTRCDDDMTARFFVASTGRNEPCIWLAARPNEQLSLCAEGQPAREVCKETCRVCSDFCFDTNAKFDYNGVRRNCLWLSLRTNVINEVCVPGNGAFQVCPETCNNPTCDGLANPTTPVPTPAPVPVLIITTPPPTPSPTPPPVSGNFCDDDRFGTFFVPSAGKSERCVWLAARPVEQAELCRAGQPARSVCRETCGACTDTCEDTNGRFTLNNVRRDCLWLSLRNNVIDQVCTPGSEASIMCPETCNACDASTRRR